MNKDINVAFLVDGSFLPIRNGTDYSIFTLMKALSKTKNIKPSLFLCWRGWDNPTAYHHQFFRTIFLPIKNFYHNNSVLEYTLTTLAIDFLHIYNAEEVINLADRIQKVGVKVIYEAINIDHVLYGGLGAEADTVSAMKALQTEAMETADFVLCRSSVDMSHILKMGIDENKVKIYRGAINTKDISPPVNRSPGKKILFLGNMYYPPNENALKIIAKEILPALNKIDKKYNIEVIGDTPSAVAAEYASSGIVFRNGVDDLGSALSQYNVAIAPIYEGSGTRLKLLDFMASGIPTISTSLGIEGLHEDIRSSLVVENNVARYAQQIHEIVSDKNKYRKLSQNGRKYVETHYSWSTNLDPFIDTYTSRL